MEILADTNVLESLAPVEPTQYVIIIGYRGEQVRAHLGRAYQGTPIEYVTQAERRGLAHAILQGDSAIDDNFVVCNGDNVLAGDLAPLAGAHAGAATMLVEGADPAVAAQTGVVLTDESGAVEHVIEKPGAEALDGDRPLVSAGAFVFSPAIFEACRAIETAHTGEYELADAINWLVEAGRRVETVWLQGDRVNVNTPGDIAVAEAMLIG